MIQYQRFSLDNGLQCVVHEDHSTPLVAVNILYKVGSKDEPENKTGFAHLFEHLMFGGSANIPDFDAPMQWAGGESNAFTNNDITNFYDVVPAENIEIPFWLESDRMLQLNFSETALDTQRKVVVEEFKETCLNQPYGDVWHKLFGLAFEKHPYRWPTIGSTPKHVEEAQLEDVKAFFYKYYRPNNAILVVSGNCEMEKVKALANKWFGDIPKGLDFERKIPQEPKQRHFKHQDTIAKVPVDALYMAFHIEGRKHKEYYIADIITDILASGQSSRLFRKLLKEQKLFTEIDAYITGSIEPGLLIVEGRPVDGVSLEEAQQAVWKELNLLKDRPLSITELQKIQNRMESTLIFSESNILNKAMNLAFFEAIGDIELINREADLYQAITTADIQHAAKSIFKPENCSELFYKAEV